MLLLWLDFGELYNCAITVQEICTGKLSVKEPQWYIITAWQSFRRNNLWVYKPMNMKEKATDADHQRADKVEIAVQLDSELLEQIQHLTNDPSKVIEVAIRQWLRGEVPRDDELTRNPRRIPIPPRGEWNDWQQ